VNVCWWHVPKIVRIGGCVLKLQPVKLGTFFETQCTALTERQMHGQTDRQTSFDSVVRIIMHGDAWSPVHTGDKVDCCRNRRQIGNNVDCCRYGRLCHQCVRGQSDTVDFVCRLSRKSTVLNSTLSPVCTGLKGAFTRTLHEWFHWNASSCWLSHRTDRSATAVYGNGRIRIFFNGQATANRFDRYCPLQTTLH